MSSREFVHTKAICTHVDEKVPGFESEIGLRLCSYCIIVVEKVKGKSWGYGKIVEKNCNNKFCGSV